MLEQFHVMMSQHDDKGLASPPVRNQVAAVTPSPAVGGGLSGPMRTSIAGESPESSVSTPAGTGEVTLGKGKASSVAIQSRLATPLASNPTRLFGSSSGKSVKSSPATPVRLVDQRNWRHRHSKNSTPSSTLEGHTSTTKGEGGRDAKEGKSDKVGNLPNRFVAGDISVAVKGYCRDVGGAFYHSRNGQYVSDEGTVMAAEVMGVDHIITGYECIADGYYRRLAGSTCVTTSSLRAIQLPEFAEPRGYFGKLVQRCAEAIGRRAVWSDYRYSLSGSVHLRPAVVSSEVNTWLLTRAVACADPYTYRSNALSLLLKEYPRFPHEILIDTAAAAYVDFTMRVGERLLGTGIAEACAEVSKARGIRNRYQVAGNGLFVLENCSSLSNTVETGFIRGYGQEVVVQPSGEPTDYWTTVEGRCGASFQAGKIIFSNGTARLQAKQYKSFIGPVFNIGMFVLFDNSHTNYSAAASRLLTLPTGWAERSLSQIRSVMPLVFSLASLTYVDVPSIYSMGELIGVPVTEMDMAYRVSCASVNPLAQLFSKAVVPMLSTGSIFSRVWEFASRPHAKRVQRVSTVARMDKFPGLYHSTPTPISVDFKKHEFILPLKLPRVTANMGPVATVSTGFVSDYIKPTLARFGSDSSERTAFIILEPGIESMSAYFKACERVYNSSTTSYVFGCHGDDGSLVFTHKGVTYFLNVDINKCDGSLTPAIHLLDAVIALSNGADEEDTTRYLLECKRDFVFSNPDDPAQRVVLRPSRVIGCSGHPGTTSRNCEASAICLYSGAQRMVELASQGVDFSPVDVLETVYLEYGFKVSIGVATSLYGVTLCRRHPARMPDGSLTAMLSLSSILRGFGTCDGELATVVRGRDRADREQKFLKQVVDSYNGEPESFVLTLLRQKFSPRLFVGPSVTPNTFVERYGISLSNIAILEGKIRKCGVGSSVFDDTLRQMYAYDYEL